MTFGQFLSILRARLWVALAVFFTVVLATVAVSLLLPKQYTGSASVVIDVKPDPVSAMAFPSMAMPSFMATQVDIITSDRVALRVIRDLKLLIVDEPTVGIDIGAKEEMYQTIERLASEGVAILVVSSDLPELTRLSDRIIVLRKGRIIKEFAEGVVTEEDVLRAASGIVDGGSK